MNPENGPAYNPYAPPSAAVAAAAGTVQLATDEDRAAIAEMLAALDEHVASASALAGDEEIRGGPLTTRTIVLGVLLAACAMGVVAGLGAGDGGLVILGATSVVFGIIFLIATLVSLANDSSTRRIQTEAEPEQAVRRYFEALRTRRWGRAFACLVPTARRGPTMRPPAFEKIRSDQAAVPNRGASSFRKYWQAVIGGPALRSRSVRVKRVWLETSNPDGTAMVAAELEITDYPALIALALLLNILLVLILYFALRKIERKTARKLVARRGDRWYIAEAGFEGRLDLLRW